MTVSAPLAFLDVLGGSEMMLILVITLVLFGGDKLPELARGIGKAMREFRRAASEVETEFKRALDEDEKKKAATKSSAPTPTPAPHLHDPVPASEAHPEHIPSHWEPHAPPPSVPAPPAAVEPEPPKPAP